MRACDYCEICEAKHEAQYASMEEAVCEKYKKAIGYELDGIRGIARRLKDERESMRLLHYLERIEERIGWITQTKG